VPDNPKVGVTRADRYALPVPERMIAFVNSEKRASYGKGPAHHASITDTTDASDPCLLSLLPEPLPAPGASYSDFPSRGRWCGPHNINETPFHPDVEKQGDPCGIAQNARATGLRANKPLISDTRAPMDVDRDSAPTHSASDISHQYSGRAVDVRHNAATPGKPSGDHLRHVGPTAVAYFPPMGDSTIQMAVCRFSATIKIAFKIGVGDSADGRRALHRPPR